MSGGFRVPGGVRATATGVPGATAPRARVAPSGEWRESQGIELLMVPPDGYWRCRLCGEWGGPIPGIPGDGYVMEAKRIGMDHRYREHDLPAARRTEARKAARRVGGRTMVAARFDAMVADLSQRYEVKPEDVHVIIHAVAVRIEGLRDARGLMWGFRESRETRNLKEANDLVDEISRELGSPTWRVRSGADATVTYYWQQGLDRS